MSFFSFLRLKSYLLFFFQSHPINSSQLPITYLGTKLRINAQYLEERPISHPHHVFIHSFIRMCFHSVMFLKGCECTNYFPRSLWEIQRYILILIFSNYKLLAWILYCCSIVFLTKWKHGSHLIKNLLTELYTCWRSSHLWNSSHFTIVWDIQIVSAKFQILPGSVLTLNLATRCIFKKGK